MEMLTTNDKSSETVMVEDDGGKGAESGQSKSPMSAGPARKTGNASEWRGEVFLSEAGQAESAASGRKKSVVDGISETVSRFLGGSNSSVGHEVMA